MQIAGDLNDEYFIMSMISRHVHWNLNSIAPSPGICKLDELRLLLSNLGKECHILGITETWLSSNLKNSEIQITGYCVERLDRDEINLPFSKLGGGGPELLHISTKIFHMLDEKI